MFMVLVVVVVVVAKGLLQHHQDDKMVEDTHAHGQVNEQVRDIDYWLRFLVETLGF
jgi:hypothetical protein